MRVYMSDTRNDNTLVDMNDSLSLCLSVVWRQLRRMWMDAIHSAATTTIHFQRGSDKDELQICHVEVS